MLAYRSKTLLPLYDPTNSRDHAPVVELADYNDDASFTTTADCRATTLVQARSLLQECEAGIHTEAEWRKRPSHPPLAGLTPRVEATRWSALDTAVREVGAETSANQHVVKIVLRSMTLRLEIAGKTVHDGAVVPGTLHVTEPGAPARGLFRGPYDILHLHVPNELIAECTRSMDLEPRSGPALPWTLGLVQDPTVERLGRALLTADQIGGAFRPLYADCLGVAIVTRLLSHTGAGSASAGRASAGLPKWRLRRAIDLIEARLGEPVTLADMAAVTGLSRMHFAAQFKASTGLRPHEYLLRRRIERAQEMLLIADLAVVDVALSVGFQTQSHFTTTFARLVGRTPHAWRVAQFGRMSHSPAGGAGRNP